MGKKISPINSQLLVFDYPVQMVMHYICNLSLPLADKFTEHMIDDKNKWKTVTSCVVQLSIFQKTSCFVYIKVDN